MIVYLDASALVKHYLVENGSAEVNALIASAQALGTAAISRAEVAAALAKATRMGALSRDEAQAALQVFYTQWPDLVRLQLTEVILARAGELAWTHSLRGYDAVHLAAAHFWQTSLGETVTLAAFDRRLWEASAQIGLQAWPPDLSPFLGRTSKEGR